MLFEARNKETESMSMVELWTLWLGDKTIPRKAPSKSFVRSEKSSPAETTKNAQHASYFSRESGRPREILSHIVWTTRGGRFK